MTAKITLSDLQAAHVERQKEWCPDQKPDLSFRGNEMAGEVGEACNVIKKLERERHGWRGSRATKEQLAEELADVVHTAVLYAITAGIDLEPAVIDKFNSTSEKNGLASRIRSCLIDKPEAVEGVAVDGWYDGAPGKPWAEEWFIAETTWGDRVVLTALPEEWTYDFKTADDTYIKADKIKRWMQFPDSQYISPAPADTDAAQSESGAFDTIVAARKAYVDAGAAYNARLEFVRAERERGNWLNVDPEYAAMSEAQSAFYRTVQDLANAAIRQRAEEKR
ncbi:MULTISPECIES: MazG-like family protein [Sinorhizobium]|uniref:MazG-like family protein n=1 Tax=Sinorhizobium TaxID=28105 RepID=UPI0013E3C5A8|nr:MULTISPECIES: MazG-like family protein [Sinorhizobium]MBO1962362.1 MazG-like family protein [Sinorhizobium medicae]